MRAIGKHYLTLPICFDGEAVCDCIAIQTANNLLCNWPNDDRSYHLCDELSRMVRFWASMGHQIIIGSLQNNFKRLKIE